MTAKALGLMVPQSLAAWAMSPLPPVMRRFPSSPSRSSIGAFRRRCSLPGSFIELRLAARDHMPADIPFQGWLGSYITFRRCGSSSIQGSVLAGCR
jgi:hypothetical protein